MLNLIFPVLFIVCIFQNGSCKRYDNYTLYRGVPVTETHLEFFNNLTKAYKVDFWRDPSVVNKPIEFIIPPEHQEKFLSEAEKLNIYLTTLMENVQGAFDQQTVRKYIRRNMDSFGWQDFFRGDDIYNWLRDLNKLFPLEMQLQSIGKTHHNREILCARIFLNKGPKHRAKVIIEGGIHAREWAAPAFVTYMLNEIIHSEQRNNTILSYVARKYEWYFIPVANPDGYEYTFTTDRMWRKNLNYHGVDLNRNFGYQFGTVGVERDKTSSIYCGPHAFSEKESQALRDFINATSDNLRYYLSFHSYGQYMVIPYAHSRGHHENYYEVKSICTQAASRIHSLYGTRYTIGNAFDTVGYLVSGASTCWVKKTFRVPYTLTFELRDEGTYGFALPPDQILPTCHETMLGVLSLLTYKPPDDLIQYLSGGQNNTVSNIVLIFMNIFLYIIVHFE